MFSKIRFKYLAGAVAVALSGHAFAQTTTDIGSSSSLWLTINDTTTQSGYVFDTGLSVTNFNQDADYSTTLTATAGSNFADFLNSIGTGDNVEYSVLGGEESAAQTAPVTLDATSNTFNGAVKNNGDVATAYGRINTFLGQINNPAGSDSYQSAASLSSWYASGGETGLEASTEFGSTDSAAIGTALGFYQLTATGITGHTTTGNTETTYAGTWDLVDDGVVGGVTEYTLSYATSASTSPVPLPAPLLLLLSGLGLMGLVARRRSSGPSDFGGAVA